MRAKSFVAVAFALGAAGFATSGNAASNFQLMHTSWTFMDHQTKAIESIDDQGNFIEQSVARGKHLDHGTVAMKNGKACFDSAMDKEGESCWTVRPVKIGHWMVTTNDKGRKLRVTRVAYKPLQMPK